MDRYIPPYEITDRMTALISDIAEKVGRMARLWQTVCLAEWKPVFADLPRFGTHACQI